MDKAEGEYIPRAMTETRKSIVAGLRNNLDDKRYKSPFCIVQELIQNADDAGASKLIMGYGILPENQRSSLHPLLADEAIFFINDGEVSKDDLNHIFHFSESNKETSPEKIGKFGLGMKSVFHVCEALVLAWDQPEHREELENTADIMDPWYDDHAQGNTSESRNQWVDAFAKGHVEISASLKQRIAPLVDGWPRWFCLWLPLRKKWMTEDGYEAIAPDEWTHSKVEKELFSQELSPKIAELLPFLSHLNGIVIADASESEPSIIDSITVEAARRLTRVDGPLDMRIKHTSEGLQECVVSGNEHCLDTKPGSDEPEHVAAVWCRNSQASENGAQFAVKYCAFLPLIANPLDDARDSTLAFDVTLQLHATFAVDAGRQAFLMAETADAKAGHRRNWHLFCEGLLPMLLPTLSKTAETWTQHDISAAVACLKGYLEHKVAKECPSCMDFVIRPGQYQNCLTEDGWKWQLLPGTTKCLPVPDLQDAAVLRALAGYFHKSEVQLINQETPGIGPTHSRDIAGAVVNYLNNFLRSKNDQRHSATFIEWLSALLEERELSQEHQRLLLTSLVKDMNFETYQEQQVRLSQLFSHLDKTAFRVSQAPSCWREKTFEQWKKLALLKGLQVMPVVFDDRPSHLQKEDSEQLAQRLPHADMPIESQQILLPEVAKMLRSKDDDISSLGREIIFAALPHCQGLKENAGLRRLEIIPLQDAEGKPFFASVGQIVDKELRVYQAGGRTVELRKYSKAAKITYYTFRHTENASIIKELGVGTFDVAQMDEFFPEEALPELNAPKDRVELFKSLAQNSDKHYTLLRYLLQGDKEQFRSRETLYILTGTNGIVSRGEELFWERLLECYFRVTGKHQTNLPKELVREMSDDVMTRLNIQRLDHDRIIKEIGKLDKNSLMSMELQATADSLKHLLHSVSCSDPEVARGVMRLPVFPFEDGSYGPLLNREDVLFVGEDAWKDIPDICKGHYRVCAAPHRTLKPIYEAYGKAIPCWNAEKALRFCLDHWETGEENLAALAAKAVDGLAKAGKKEVLKDASEKLQEVTFLQSADGHMIAPGHVLNLQLDSQDVASRLEKCGIYTASKVTWEPFCENAQKWIQEELLPGDGEYCSIVGKALAETQGTDYTLGYFGKDALKNADISDLLNSSVAERQFPAVHIAKAIRDSLGDKRNAGAMTDFFRDLTIKPLPHKRLVEVCNDLLKNCTDGPSRLYLKYLELAVTSTMQIDDSLSFPNAYGEISTPSRLVCSGEGIDRAQLLHRKCRYLFEERNGHNSLPSAHKPGFGNCHNLSKADWQQRVDDSTERIKEYFKGWQEDAYCYIGALLALCDGCGCLTDYIKSHFWERCNPDWVRQMAFGTPKVLAEENADEPTAEESSEASETVGKDAIARSKGCHLIVDVYAGAQRKMPNLLGREIEVNIESADKLESLLVGEKGQSWGYVEKPIAGRMPDITPKSIFLCLRGLSRAAIEHISKEQQIKLIKRTFGCVVECFAGQTYNLSALWEYIEQKEFFDLEIVREKILDGLATYLPQLNIWDGEAYECLARWDDARNKLVEAQLSKDKDHEERVKSAASEVEEAKKDLRELCEKDGTVQMQIVEAIRSRITEHCGYHFDSIPFELFQNADDAVAEVPGISDSRRTMVMELTSNALSILHFGRPINKCVDEDCQDRSTRGNRQDLEKMLMLYRSDKSAGKLQRTGKFGLGFKSVYQITDSPLIASANLHFRIRGTLFPIDVKKDADEEALLNGVRERLRRRAVNDDGLHQETVMHLPIRKDVHVQASSEKPADGTFSLKRLLDMGELLVLFARNIRRLIVIDHGNVFNFEIDRKSGLYGFDILKTQPNQKAFALIRKLPHHASIALGFSMKEMVIEPLDARFATIWNTEPADACYDIGFAINGDFKLDIGRNELMPKENDAMAWKIGAGLHEFLNANCRAISAEWKRQLWQCFAVKGGGRWNVRTDNDGGLGTCLPHIIWGTKEKPNGYGKFIKENRVIPCGLPDEAERFLKLDECQYAWEGEDDEWRLFRHFLPAGERQAIVSGGVAEVLKAALRHDMKDRILDAKTILTHWFENHRCIAPEEANALPWREVVEYCEKTRMELPWAAYGCSFRNRLGTPVAPERLLPLEDSGSDEWALLRAFASDAAFLSEEYNDEARSLFAAMRGTAGIGPDQIVQWILGTNNDESKRQAIIDYLQRGEKAHKVAQELEPYDSLDDTLKKEVQGKLQGYRVAMGMQSAEWFILDDDGSGDGSETFTGTFDGSTKEWLLANWADCKDGIIRSFNWDNYGTEKGAAALALNDESLSPEERRRWMEMFILAMCRRFGRQRDFQHRGFIGLCLEREWMDIFAAPPAECEPGKWMRVLDECYDECLGSMDYDYWMQLFPWIYRINKCLDRYIQILRGANHLKYTPESLDDLFTPSSSQRWQGTQLRVPSLMPCLGKLGGHWLLRELVRSGTLTNPALHKLCYVPSASVRKLFGDENITSLDIYERMDKNNFDLAFDLAFRALDKMDNGEER